MPDVILPALNEERAVAWVLGRMPPGFRPIVVDNGSTDRTASIARANGAVVVEEPVRGFGSACWAGLGAASADVVCFMDCDGSLDPLVLPALVAYVERDECDLVIGERVARRGAWPAHARVANRVLAWEVRRRTALTLTDLGPMRVVAREGLLRLGMTDRRSGWPLEMVLRASRAGWRVRGVPTEYVEREGRSKVTGTIRGTLRAVGDMTGYLRDSELGQRSAKCGTVDATCAGASDVAPRDRSVAPCT